MSNDTITSFLRAARRRLWLEAALRQLRTAVWVSSGVLVLMAFVHIGWSPLRFSVALAIATVAGLVVMSLVLISRPPLAECALRVDRHFSGHSLITTAHELGRLAASPPAAQTVMARATSTAADWRPRLGTLWRAPHGTTFVLAIVPAFFAVLMLELPPKDDGLTEASDAQSSLLGSLEAENSLFDEASDLPELRDAIAQSTMDKHGQTRPEAATVDRTAPVRGDLQPEAASEFTERVETDALSSGFASAAQEGGPGPGDARRSAEEFERRTGESPPLFSARADTAIARHGAAAAGRSDSDNEFVGRAQSSRAANRRIVPAPAPPVSSAWTTLTTAEVAYARHYLDAAGRPRD